MPDGGYSRICPACGRRVPRTVNACRCGAALPVESVAAPEPIARTDGYAAGFRAAVTIVIAVGVLGGAAYWAARPPDAARTPSASSSPGPRPDRPAATVTDMGTPVMLDAPRPRPGASVDATSPPATPAPPIPPAPLAPLEDIVSRVMPAVVLIETPTARGSGFFVKPDTLITNVHVVESYDYVTVRKTDGSSMTAHVESRTPAFDIAVLTVASPSAGQATIPMGTTTTLRVGQEVFAIGSALGTLQNTVTRGIVSALRRSGSATLVQTDTSINPGNSGGPLLDRSGTVIGINTMGYRDSQGLNFAVAIEHARAVLDGVAAPSTTALAATTTDLRDIAPSTSSDTDRVRLEGERAYDQRLSGMARAADTLDGDWGRFREQCYSARIAGTFDHAWFALLTDGAMPEPVPPQCQNFLTALKRAADGFRVQMQQAEADARHAGVYPGVLRDVRRRYRIEHDAWNR